VSVNAFVESAASLGAAGAAGAALVSDGQRARARWMLGGLVLAGVALEPLVRHRVSERPTVAAVGGALALVAIAVLAYVIRRRPDSFALLAFLALPFRVPLTVGGDSANLLIPLYGVLVAAAVAYLLRPPAPGPEPPRSVARLDRVLAIVLVLYAVQALYSDDVAQATKNICFFYVPFAILYRLLREVRWTAELLKRCLYVIVGLALVFAVIGFGEFATKHLLISNAKVLHANEIKPYFRVNSLFFDPNIYGRFLALTMIALATRLLWSERPREVTVIGIVLAVLWAGLVLSLSQSSFAALVVGLAILAALRWRPGPVVAVAAAAVVAAIVVIVAAPGTIGLKDRSSKGLDSATSGRTKLITGGLKMFGDRPVYGFGAGSFQKRYRAREHIRSKRIAAISHTIPVTIAAEQGVVGLLAYLALLACALIVLFTGLRAELRARPPPAETLARVVAAAAFCALVIHTFIYAAFLEDPLTWALLGLATALLLQRSAGSSPRAQRPSSAG
jgi:putative inorganic carbon (HCO3(-)) transporter